MSDQLRLMWLSGRLLSSPLIDVWQPTLTAQDPEIPNLPLEEPAGAPPAGGGGAVVRAYVLEAYDNPVEVALTAFSAGNSLLVLTVTSASELPTSVTDDGSEGGSYSLDHSHSNTEFGTVMRCYARHNITDGPTTVFVNYTGAFLGTVEVFEVSGLLTSDPIDGTQYEAPGASDDSIDTAFTANYANSLAVASVEIAVDRSITPLDGWESVLATSEYHHALFKEDLGAAGSKQLLATLSSGMQHGQAIYVYRTAGAAPDDSAAEESGTLADSQSASIVHGTRTIAESDTGTDSQSSVQVTARAAEEADAMADTSSGTYLTTGTAEESDTDTDAQSVAVSALGTGAEADAMADASSNTAVLAGQQNEIDFTADAASSTYTVTGAGEEADTLADAQSRTYATAGAGEDSTTEEDDTAATYSVDADEDEADALADATAATAAYPAAQAEADTLTDEATGEATGTANAEEATDLTDTTAGTAATTSASEEADSLGDDTQSTAYLVASAQESAGATDSQLGTARYTVAQAEAAADVEDTQGVNFGAVSSGQESTDQTDTTSGQATIGAGQEEADALAAAETATKATAGSSEDSTDATDARQGTYATTGTDQQATDATDASSVQLHAVASTEDMTDLTDAPIATKLTQSAGEESTDLTDSSTGVNGIAASTMYESTAAVDAQSSEGSIGAVSEEASSLATTATATYSVSGLIAELSGLMEQVSATAAYFSATLEALIDVELAAGETARDAAMEDAANYADAYITSVVADAQAAEELTVDTATDALAALLAYVVEAGVSTESIAGAFGSVSVTTEQTELADLQLFARIVVEARFVYIETGAYFEEVEPAFIDTWMIVPDPGFACDVLAGPVDAIAVVQVPSGDDNSGVNDAPQFDRL